MKIFDGSNDRTILNSLANVFNIDEIKLKDNIEKYYKINKERLNIIYSYYDEFIEFMNLEEYEDSIQFDYVYFFHITSSIDYLKSIKEFGVLDLRESLIKETALKKYLQKHRIYFELNDKIELIVDGNKIIMEKFNSDECCDNDYWQNYHGEYLYHRLSFDYNVNGFLFKNNVYKDSSYFDLKDKAEFLNRLGEFINDDDICLDWKNHKKSYVLKCKMDVTQTTLGNGLTWPTKQETSKGIIEKALYYMVELEEDKKELPPITYVLINYGIAISFKDIEVLDYMIDLEDED